MYFFFHLITGIILGFLLGELLHDNRWILPCAVGSILPDLIDKPLGYLIFPTTIGYGRIYSHTLLIALIIFATGMLFWKMRRDPGLIALGLGILSHQALDQMWLQPKNWLFPFLGRFSGITTEDFFWVKMLEELHNPFELILACIMGTLVFALLYRDRIASFITERRQVLSIILSFTAIMLCSLAGIVIGSGLGGHTIRSIGWGTPGDLIMGGVVIALASWLIWHWQTVADR